ncbi:MAG: hypothetical protein Q8J74_00505 [Candidatus Didemnitutus sp.]|nr:hypothetical protein [Candidatus Didemnitutus sp.]
MNRRWILAALALGGLAALAVAGYWLLFTQFMAYDDEGYVLWSLHNYFAQGGLYTKVYSQYGPFFYVFNDVLFGVSGWSLDNETVRVVKLFYWCACAFLSAHLAWRHTGNVTVAGAAAALTFITLLVMASEPGHPGGLLALLAAGGAMAGAAAIEAGRPRTFAVVTALIGTAMLLSKINVGLFFLIAAGSWIVLHTRLGRWRRAALWFVAVGCVVAPLALMKALLHEQWVATLGFLFSCGALGLLALIQAQRREESAIAIWWVALGAAATLATLVLGATWASGTPLIALWQGVIVDPLHHPFVYVHAVQWPAFAPWLAIVALILVGLDYLLSRAPSWGVVLAVLRLLVGGWLLWQVSRAPDVSLAAFGLKYGVASVWLMMVPLVPGVATPAVRARLWVAWVFVWQVLQAYPVAGSQMGWGSFLWMPLATIGCYEAIQFLATRAPRARRILTAGAALALAGVCGLTMGRLISMGYQRYTQDEPLGVPGVQRLRLSDDYTINLRLLVRNINAHAGTLFSYPGLFSFNLWTGRPTPTLANVTHWFSLLNEEQQQAIITQLETDPRSVVIVQSHIINYLVFHNLAPKGLLRDYILKHYHAAFRLDTYELWVRRGRQIAQLGIARLHIAPDGPPRLELCTDAVGQATAVELQFLYAPFRPLLRLPLDATTGWKLTPLAPDGSPVGSTVDAALPVLLTGITRLETNLSQSPTLLPSLDQLRLVVLDDAGRTLDVLRFAN